MQTVVMPKMGDTMEEGKILRWIKREGDTVQKGDALAEIETDKVNIEAEAFAAGVLRKIIAQEGESIPIGQPIALIGKADEPLPDEAAKTAKPAKAASKQAQANGTAAAATPASAAGTAVAEPPAPETTGAGQNGQNGGRIVRDDVQAYLASPQAAAAAPVAPQAQPAAQPTAPAQPAVPSVPAATPGEEVRAQPLSNIRKTIARRLQQSMQTAPHFYVTVAIETNKLGEVRGAINEYAAGLPNPAKVSYNDLIVKAVADALRAQPAMRVAFGGDQLLTTDRVNVGVAVALPDGLIVPVIRDADRKGVRAIASEAHALSDRARAGKLTLEEFSGGTFTISNLGMYGVDHFTAVINPPEAAILAVGAARDEPVVRDGELVAGTTMKLTLTIDHRVLDGAAAAAFLRDLVGLLEQPLRILA
jgi:pyruvate dehydrogenase E2 component (dihydrolipoamide acetyltransferase)